jgi:hypothetical protein
MISSTKEHYSCARISQAIGFFTTNRKWLKVKQICPAKAGGQKVAVIFSLCFLWFFLADNNDLEPSLLGIIGCF